MTDDFCHVCDAEGEDFCVCEEDPDPQSYKELKLEADRRTRKSHKENEFKDKLKSVSFKRVKGGGRDT